MPDPSNTNSASDDALRNDALQHVSIMNDEGMTYGIPTKLFYGGIVLSIAFSVILRWWSGFGFACVYFFSMYEIHKDDPRAFQGWIEAALMKREDVWTNGIHKQRKIFFIDDKD